MQFQANKRLLPHALPRVTGQPACVLIFVILVHLTKNVVLKTMMDAQFPRTTAAAINNTRVKVRNYLTILTDLWLLVQGSFDVRVVSSLFTYVKGELKAKIDYSLS